MRNPHQILTRIAEALGVPVETFSSGSFVAHDCEMLSELIALWLSLERGSDRNKVLAYVRAIIAAQQQGSERS